MNHKLEFRNRNLEKLQAPAVGLAIASEPTDRLQKWIVRGE